MLKDIYCDWNVYFFRVTPHIASSAKGDHEAPVLPKQLILFLSLVALMIESITQLGRKYCSN